MFVPPAGVDATTEDRPAVLGGRIRLNRQGHRVLWILGIGYLCSLLAAGPADDVIRKPPAAHQMAAAEQPAAKTAKLVKPAPTREQKRRVVVVTSIVIAGILTVLLLMLLWIVWWSRRTHRLLRAPLPAANRGDELWYLKTKRPLCPPANPTASNPAPDSPPAPPQA